MNPQLEHLKTEFIGSTVEIDWTKKSDHKRDGFNVKNWINEKVVDVRQFGDGEFYLILENNPHTPVNICRIKALHS